jgi:hypothetical protein
MTAPSTTGWNGRRSETLPSVSSSAEVACWAASSVATGASSRPRVIGVEVAEQHQIGDLGGLVRARDVVARAALGDGGVEQPPAAAGVPSSVATLMPPADSPKIVTRPGSPPKALDVVAHPPQRGHLVEQPEVAGPGVVVAQDRLDVPEPQGAEAVVDATTTTSPRRARLVASYQGMLPDPR